MLTRVKLRILALEALRNARTLAGENVYEYDWPTNKLTQPAILLNWDKEHKESMARTQPNFTTVARLILDIRIMAEDVVTARTRLDTLLWQIEQAILTDYNLRKQVQQFPFVDTESHIDSTTGEHIALAMMAIGLEFFEDQNQYPPVNAVPLDQVAINVDLVNVFDATGTYPNPPFPNAVEPAPRSQGPDGRLEGFVDFQNLND
jgi:hypothetical protein